MSKEISTFDVVLQRLAQKMNKLGWKKETIFYWVDVGDYMDFQLCIKQGEVFYNVSIDHYHFTSDIVEYWKAPLFWEICKELPSKIQYDPDLDNVAFLTMGKGTHSQAKDTDFCIYYEKDTGQELWDSFFNNINPAEASGELWCFSREKGYIKEE